MENRNKEDNVDFLVTITPHPSAKGRKAIQAVLQEDFGFEAAIDYSPLMESGPELITKALSVLGKGTGQIQSATKKVGGTTQHMVFSLPLKFVTYENPIKDVLEPVKELLMIAIPPTKELTRIGDASKVMITIGKFFSIEEAIIVSGAPAYSKDLIYDEGTGQSYPMSATINLQVSSTKVISQQDIDSWLLTG